MYLKKEQTLMHLSKKGGRTKLVGNDFAQNWPKITPKLPQTTTQNEQIKWGCRKKSELLVGVGFLDIKNYI